MTPEEAAYAALGLQPNAPRPAVDEAYRRLIKRYHPDRTGGDGDRAAEINHAYTQICRHTAAGAGRNIVRADREYPRRRRSRSGSWLLLLAVGLAGVFAALWQSGTAIPIGRPGGERTRWISAPAESGADAIVTQMPDFDEPLQTELVNRAAAQAVTFHGEGDLAATLAYSRSCHKRFRDRPSLAWFDACTAFDEATLILNGDKAFDDSGFLGPSALVSRQMAEARALTDDMLAADSRVHQIRLQVELALIPNSDAARP